MIDPVRIVAMRPEGAHQVLEICQLGIDPVRIDRDVVEPPRVTHVVPLVGNDDRRSGRHAEVLRWFWPQHLGWHCGACRSMAVSGYALTG